MMAREPEMTTERLDILEYAGRQSSITWGQLHRRGYHYMTVRSLVRWGYLSSPSAYHYLLTRKGLNALLIAGKGGTFRPDGVSIFSEALRNDREDG